MPYIVLYRVALHFGRRAVKLWCISGMVIWWCYAVDTILQIQTNGPGRTRIPSRHGPTGEFGMEPAYSILLQITKSRLAVLSKCLTIVDSAILCQATRDITL